VLSLADQAFARRTRWAELHLAPGRCRRLSRHSLLRINSPKVALRSDARRRRQLGRFRSGSFSLPPHEADAGWDPRRNCLPADQIRSALLSGSGDVAS